MTTPATPGLPTSSPSRDPQRDLIMAPFISKTFGEPKFHTEGDIAAVAFSDDGNLHSIDETGALRKWSPDGKLLRHTFLSDLETLWAFDSSGRLLASGNDDLVLWDVNEAQLLKRIEQDSWVTAVAFSPDGRLVASGHDDGRVRIYDVASQQLVGELRAHPMPVSAIAFSPRRDFLATAGEDRVIRVWDETTHKLETELVSHTDRIPALAWSHDGSLLVSAGWDTSARVWNPESSDPLILLNSHAEQVVMAAFSPVNNTVATADSDYEIRLWTDPAGGKSSFVLRGHADEIRALAFNRDGTRLASAGVDRVIAIWDTVKGVLAAGPKPIDKHSVATATVNGKVCLASTGETTFRFWDVESGSELAPSGDGTAHTVATCGARVAVGGNDHFIRFYDLETGVAKKLEATKPPIGALSFHKSGLKLAHNSPIDGLTWIWDTETGEPLLILIEAADGCTLESVAFHPDGNRVAVGGIDYLSTGERDGAVCIWDLTTKEKQVTFDDGVLSLDIDSTGRYMAGAGISERVFVWDLESNELAFELEGHTDRINAVAFSPDGNYVISGGDDMTLRVWDVLSGRLIVAREVDSRVQSLAFSPDGQFLYTGNGNTTCSRIDFKKLVEE